MENQSFTSRLIDASIIIAVFTAILYEMAYNYIQETYKIFNVPLSLINIDLNDVLSYTTYSLFPYTLSILIFFINEEVISKMLRITNESTKVMIMIFHPVIFLLVLNGLAKYDYSFKTLVLISVSVTILVVQLIGQIIRSIVTVSIQWSRIKPGFVLEYQNIQKKVTYLNILMVLLTVPFYSAVQSKIFNYHNHKYIVFGELPNIILIGKSGENFVGKYFDRSKNVLLDSVILIKPSEGKKFTMKSTELNLKLNIDYHF